MLGFKQRNATKEKTGKISLLLGNNQPAVGKIIVEKKFVACTTVEEHPSARLVAVEKWEHFGMGPHPAKTRMP